MKQLRLPVELQGRALVNMSNIGRESMAQIKQTQSTKVYRGHLNLFTFIQVCFPLNGEEVVVEGLLSSRNSLSVQICRKNNSIANVNLLQDTWKLCLNANQRLAVEKMEMQA